MNIDKLIETIVNRRVFHSDRFHKLTSISDFGQNTVEKANPKEWTIINYKSYPRLERIKLPKSLQLKGKLDDIITERRSQRNFSVQKYIRLDELATLLKFSSGITKMSGSDWNTGLRAYPSAGARFPLELYLAVNKVRSLKNGLYHYNLKEHSLELLRQGSFNDLLSKNTDQGFVKESSFVVIVTAVFERTRIKYEDRGYRFILLEAGHLGQNLYLVSTALKIKCCACGGFIDQDLNSFLDLEGQNEKAIYTFAFGR